MNALHLVTVIVAGRRIDGSNFARIADGVVVAPLDPFVRAFAERITAGGSSRFVIVRGSRSVSIAIGERDLPVAPYVCDGETFVPLASIARALGASVDYDARSRTLAIWLPPEPLGTITPSAAYVPPPGPLRTFAPKETPAPAPSVTGIPHPRRTPIVVFERRGRLESPAP